MQRKNVLAGPYLDRESHRRQDPGWIAAALAAPGSRAIPVWHSRNLVTGGEAPRAVFLSVATLGDAERRDENLILLGQSAGVYYFCYEIEALDPPSLGDGARFEDLRMLAASLPQAEAGLLAYARALIWWRRRHRHCGMCAAPTLAGRGGHVVVCTNPACRNEEFPRIDPAIIVLVSEGERVLLGRQTGWPLGRYSTIAGFVEPGESLEDAVVREVMEETGIEVDGVEYHSSQPWPFPASLMLGFTARAVTCEVQRRDDELEDARWFTRAQITAGIPILPPSQSISFRLIEDWFDARSERPLRDIHGVAAWPQSS